MFVPFDVDVAGLLTGQEVTVFQNHIFCIPDDDSQFVPVNRLMGYLPHPQPL